MSKKNYLLGLVTMIMVAMLSVGFVSCGSDDDADDLEKTENLSNQDPEGTVVVNMNNGSSDNWVDVGIGSDYGRIHIDEANNFEGYSSSVVEFASVGLVNGLSSVNTIPTVGWSKSIAVVPGTGYVAKNGSGNKILYTRFISVPLKLGRVKY